MAAVADMSAAARAVSPLDVYATLLQESIGEETDPGLARRLAAVLPLHITALPTRPEDVTLEMVTLALREAAAPETGGLTEAVMRAVRRHLSALGLYLESTAERLWGRTIQVTNEATGRVYGLHLSAKSPGPSASPAVRESGPQWHLSHQRVDQPSSLTITIRAERLSPLACRLLVRADRPGTQQLSGHEIRVNYAGQEQSERTDEQGVAHFAPIPIAALADLSIYVGTE